MQPTPREIYTACGPLELKIFYHPTLSCIKLCLALYSLLIPHLLPSTAGSLRFDSHSGQTFYLSLCLV